MLKFIHPTSWLEVSREGVGRRRGGGGGGRGGGGRGRRNSAGQADMFFFVLHESFWYLFPGNFCPLPSALCPLPSALRPLPSTLHPTSDHKRNSRGSKRYKKEKAWTKKANVKCYIKTGKNLKEMLHVKKNRGCLKEFNSNISSRRFSEK